VTELCIIVRFDDKAETSNRRPSSQPADRSRDAVASDLFNDAIFGSDDTDWLEMASASGSKKSSQAKSTAADRPLSEGNVSDRTAAPRQGNNS